MFCALQHRECFLYVWYSAKLATYVRESTREIMLRIAAVLQFLGDDVPRSFQIRRNSPRIFR